MNDKAASIPDLVFNTVGRALLVGASAGAVLAALSGLAQLPFGDLIYAAPIAAGIAVALVVELGAQVFEGKSAYGRFAASTVTLLLTAGVWLLARNVPAFHASLVALLGSTSAALAVDFADRRWRLTTSGAHVFMIAAGACLGAWLGLLSQSHLAWMRDGGLRALIAVPAGTLIALALRLRRQYAA